MAEYAPRLRPIDDMSLGRLQIAQIVVANTWMLVAKPPAEADKNKGDARQNIPAVVTKPELRTRDYENNDRRCQQNQGITLSDPWADSESKG